MKNVKEVLELINNVQIQSFYSLESFIEKKSTAILATKQRGLYWLWTNYTYEDLINILQLCL